jgi:hypothetical protein
VLVSLGVTRKVCVLYLNSGHYTKMRFSQIVVEGSRVQLRDFLLTGKLLQTTVETSKMRQLCSSLDGVNV